MSLDRVCITRIRDFVKKLKENYRKKNLLATEFALCWANAHKAHQ